MTETMISTVNRYAEALGNLDRGAYLDLFAEDAVVVDPYGGRPFVGEVGLNMFFNGFESTWESFEMLLGEPYAAGDRVAVAWTTHARSKAGVRVEFSGINLFTINEDGQISRLEGYWDMPAMIGMLRG